MCNSPDWIELKSEIKRNNFQKGETIEFKRILYMSTYPRAHAAAAPTCEFDSSSSASDKASTP